MTIESLTPFLQWITEHPHLSGFIVFLISLSESLAFVGLVIPGVILMTAIGSLMGSGRLPVMNTMLWAMLGAIVGDGISYWLGYHYQNKLSESWLFKSFSRFIEKGTLFFQRHGGKSIILGRFIGPIRPTIPVIAGVMQMDPKTFLFFNIISAILWAPIYCLPGILIGVSLGDLSSAMASMLLSLLLGMLFVLWLFFYLLLEIIIYIERKLAKFFMQHGQIGATVLLIFSVISFNFILIYVKEEQGIVYWDDTIYQCFRALYTNMVANWAIIALSFGEPLIIFSTISIVGIWLLFKDRAIACCWLGTLLAGSAVGQYYKLSLNLARPEGLMQSPDTYSFPGMHVLLATITYGLVAVFVKQILPIKYRWTLWLAALFLITIISFASIYLGLHWFSDVLAGALIGVASITIGILIYNRYCAHQAVASVLLKQLLIITSIVLLSLVTIYNFYTYKNNQQMWKRQWPADVLNVKEWWQGKSNIDSLYRSSVIKKQMIPFDLNWLGTLDSISNTLKQQGWVVLPPLTFKSSLTMLSDSVEHKLIPVFPRFHRDRLPRLVFTKVLKDNSERLVLQLWCSDYLTVDNLSLLVGTIRLENIRHHISFMNINFYVENTKQNERNKYISQLLADISDNWQHKTAEKMPSLFLIVPKNSVE